MKKHKYKIGKISPHFRCSSDITGVFVCEEGPCSQENCISKLFKEGCMFIYNRTQNATASIMFMQSLSSVSMQSFGN